MPLFGPNVKKMQEKGDLAGLVNAVRNGEPQIRVEAAEALMDTGNPEALDLLAKEFSSTLRLGKEADKLEAILIMRGPPTRESLGALTHTSCLELSDDRFKRIWQFEKVKFGKRFKLDLARPILIDVAMNQNENALVRWYAATALSEVGDKSEEVVQCLLSALKAISKPGMWHIEETVRSLSRFPNSSEALSFIVNIAKSEGLLRWNGIYALAALGNQSTREILDYSATHGEDQQRARAKTVLSLFGKASYDQIKGRAETK